MVQFAPMEKPPKLGDRTERLLIGAVMILLAIQAILVVQGFMRAI